MGSGVVVTVALDLLLIPRFGAVGAAVASSAAYVSSTMALVLLFRHLTRSANRSPEDSLAAQPRMEVQ
jgi:Na+-driven multidrug efflux pump